MAKFFLVRINAETTGSTPIGINGDVRHIPNNTDAVVSEDELSVLQDSSRDITVRGPATTEQAKKAGADANSRVADAKSATYIQTPGGDYLPKRSPDDTLAVSADRTPRLYGEPYTQVRGGDFLPQTPRVASAPGEGDIEAARERRDAVADGSIEPTVELTNADPHQVKLQSAGGPLAAADTAKADEDGDATFSADEFLDRNLNDINNEIDDLSPAQHRTLLVEERGGKARKSLIASLEERLG